MEKIVVISLSYKKAGLEIRSPFQFSKEERVQFYTLLKAVNEIESGVVLSTCNRTDFYLQVNDFFSPLIFIESLQKYKQQSISAQYFDVYATTSESVKYILEVSNGLHSLALGDKQIIAQIKEAYHESLQLNFISTVFERLFQRVFRTYKRVNNETEFHKGSKSVSYLALNKIKESNHITSPMLLIGAGEISADFLKYADRFGIKNITIANRSIDKAKSLAVKHNHGFIPIELIKHRLKDFRVIVSGAAADNILNAGDVPDDENHRLFIDLTTFRSLDIAPDQTNYELCTLDDLAKIRNLNEARQLNEVPLVKAVILQELNKFEEWIEQKTSYANLKEEYKKMLEYKLSLHGLCISEKLLDMLVLEMVTKKIASVNQLKSKRKTFTSSKDFKFKIHNN